MTHPIVPPEKWLEARRQLLAKEKELTRLRDRLSEERRALPWVRVEKEYVFDTSSGRRSLPQLFEGRSQLVVYHFMFDPSWESPCKSCSFWADNFERIVVHLAQRDVTLIAVSRAPLEKIDRFRRRMGWSFTWVSSGGSEFNYDYHVSFGPEALARGEIDYNYARQKNVGPEWPGISVFYKDAGGAVFHTYSCYGRGIEMMNAAYQYLDLVPKGRDEATLPHPMAWVRYRDSYAT